MSSAEKGELTRELILEAITKYINEHQYPPTVRELCKIVGLKSTATVHRHIEILKERGLLETDGEEHHMRTLRVPNRMNEFDALYLAKCKEVNRLLEQIQKLQRELDICKMKMKKYQKGANV